MKNLFQKINVQYVAVVVLFAVSLCFLSTREAHSLCIRLLMHLKGNTFVQGNPPGCIIYTIPNVQFTETYRQALRGRAINSLDDFALANASGDYFTLEPPTASESWSGHPLLEWAALRLAWVSCQRYSDLNPTNLPATNAMAIAAISNARHAIQIAQAADPTNGILWLAEAAVCFAETNNEAALAALQIAATNRNWTANSPAVFFRLSELFANAGLSEFDAAAEAKNQMPESGFFEFQGRCVRSLNQMILTAVETNDQEQFSSLLKLMVELRRAERSDRGDYAMNNFRRDQDYDEMVNAMAKQMGQNPLPESVNSSYEIRRKLRTQIFQDYLNQHAEPRTAASFLAQAEGYKTEKGLRGELRELRFRAFMWDLVWITAAGFLSLLTLSLFGIAFFFEAVVWLLRKYSNQPGKLPGQKIFWVVAAFVVIASTAVFANFWIASGIDSKVGFGPVEPPPLVSQNMQALLLSLLVGCVWLGALLLDWKSSKAPLKPWLVTFAFGFVYLLAIFAMAYFRSRTVEKIAAGFL